MTAPPPQTLVAWLAAVASAQASRPALSDDGDVRTFAEMWARAGGFARFFLQETKTAPGSRIGIVGTNEASYIEAFLGLLRAGHVAMPLNGMLDVKTLLQQLEMVDAAGVIVGNVDDDIAAGLTESMPIWRLTDLAARVGPWFGKLPELSSSSPACVIPTSGSTGVPRGALHTQSSLLHCATQIGSMLPLAPTDRSVAFLPFFASIPEQILPSLCTGGSLEIVPRFDVDRIAKACETSTCFDAIPTLMARLMNEAPLSTLARLQWVSFASEPMPPAVLRDWHAGLPGVETHQFYGMTELVPATVASHRMLLEDPTTVGVAFPTTRVTVDDDTSELFCRGPAQMLGYYNNPDATRAMLTQDGSIRTGDLGRIDEHGRVYLTGRSKDLIISGGLNVAPAEIEAVACDHPDVGGAAVVGIPDQRWGETPVVIGIAKNGSGLTPQALLTHCRSGLKGFKRPSAAGVVDAFPRTGIGKVAKQSLREQILRGDIDLVRAD